MKRKVVLALVATLTLTVGSIGTVFAMNNSQGITIQISELSNHEHVWGAKQWVVDKEAVYETVHHPAETHEEEQWVVDKEAWTETIDHPEEGHYETVTITDKEAWDEPVYDYCTVCNVCGEIIGSNYLGIHDTLDDHYAKTGCAANQGYTGNVQKQVDTIHHPAVTHEEQQWVVDKEAWTETIEHPEEGHYEHTCTDCGEVQNSETGEVITPGNPTDPETPGTDDPTTEEPETPDNTTDTGENKDQQNDNKTATADKSEKADTTVTVSTEKKSPKTGDSASLIYLATLAGSAVTGSTAFGLRRKFKK